MVMMLLQDLWKLGVIDGCIIHVIRFVSTKDTVSVSFHINDLGNQAVINCRLLFKHAVFVFVWEIYSMK